MKEEVKASAIETAATVSAENLVKFEIGKTYYGEYSVVSYSGASTVTRKVCFTIENRTQNFVTIDGQRSRVDYNIDKGEVTTRKLSRTSTSAITIWAKNIVDDKIEKDISADEVKAAAKVQMVDHEDDGSNDDPDDEDIIDNLTFEDNDDELTDRCAAWKAKVMPYTYHVLALNIQGVLTFDGKRISKKNAAEEVARAHNCGYGKNYKDLRAILLTDKTAKSYIREHAAMWYCRWGKQNDNIKLVDFGRDEIPYINQKVAAIVAYYQAQAEKEVEEKAREIAYKASPEYKLEEVEKVIADYEAEIAYHSRRIGIINKNIISYIKCIAGMEDDILKSGLEIDSLKIDLATVQAQKKKIADEIATRNAFENINKLAADIADDGSNDDSDDEEITIEYNFDVEEDDDELVDKPEVPATDPVITAAAASEIFNSIFALKDFKLVIQAAEEAVAVDTIHFDLQQFNNAVIIAGSPEEIDTAVKAAYAEVEFSPAAEDTDAEACSEEKSEREKMNDIADWAGKEFEKVYLEKNWDSAGHEDLITLITTDGAKVMLHKNFDDLNLQGLRDKILVMKDSKVLASYRTAEAFQTALTGLLEAVQCGNKEFAFPADEPKKAAAYQKKYPSFFRVTTLIKSSGSERLVGADRKFLTVTDALNYAKKIVKKNTTADCLDCSVYFDEYDHTIWDYVSTPLYGYEVRNGEENKFIDRKAINRLKRADTQPTSAALFPDLVQ